MASNGSAGQDVDLGHAPGDVVLGHEVDRARRAMPASTVPADDAAQVPAGQRLDLVVVGGDPGGRLLGVDPGQAEQGRDQVDVAGRDRDPAARRPRCPGPRRASGTRVASSKALHHFWMRPPWAPSRSPWSEVKTTMVSSAMPDALERLEDPADGLVHQLVEVVVEPPVAEVGGRLEDHLRPDAP